MHFQRDYNREMKILVTGAAGFIASAIVERLLKAGHDVVACARDGRNLPCSDRLRIHPVDLNHMLAAEDWQALLDGVGAVVNAAGILRETRRGDFERVHYRSPLALAHACVELGIRRYVQISALGEAADGEFVASKHRLDEALLAMDGVDALVLRPSVVVSLRGSYGGTSMLRAMAALPLLMVLPGDGGQKIQPVLLEDLAALVVEALELDAARPQALDVVGPEVMSLSEFLLALRRWLKLPDPVLALHVPMTLVRWAGRAGDLVRAGPLGSTMTRMLERGNVGNDPWASAAAQALSRPGSVSDCLAQSASFVQDRWQARLYWLAPVAWAALVLIWLLSGLSGLLGQTANFAPMLDRMGICPNWHASVVLATSLLNTVLGLALLIRVWIGPVLMLMWISVLAYTLGLGGLVPELWLEPTGGLVKNLGLLLLIPMVMVLENRR